MLEALELLRWVQVALFVGLALLAVVLAWRRSTRPARYLAGAFVTLALALAVGRLVETGPTLAGRLAAALVLTALLAFPWLLAGMAWAFDGRLPSWLRLTGPLLAVHALVVAGTSPLADTAASELTTSYVIAFVALWLGPSAATTLKLWRSRGRQTLVRQRLQLMAVGLALLTVALLVAAIGVGSQLPVISSATVVLSIAAALAFVAGFAPPLPLRVWWRRRSSSQFARMQQALIGAATPVEVAEAVAPMLAGLVGGGVAVIGRDGEIAAACDVDDEVLRQHRTRLLSGRATEDAQVVAVDGYWLVVQTTPYTPVFGRGERELVDSFAIQLRLALERAELFQAHLEARAEAEAASSELETTLMGLSHDLKSPTAAIVGFAGMLDDAADDEERAELVDQICTSTRYLEDLVDALLEFSKVGRTQVSVEPVDLASTLRSVRRRQGATAPGLRVDVDGSLPVVLANPVRMEQVFDNLVGNAVKHGGRDDITVTITVEPSDDGTSIVVQDDGRGLDALDADRVFVLFARGTGASRSGSGVGLGMVRRILESYGGSIVADTSHAGARFVLWLPGRIVVAADRSHDHDPDGSVAGRKARQ